jgi:thioredoxin reductase
MGLALQRGNRVTLSYRKGSFSRIKERNAQRLQECVREGRLEVVYNSIPVEIKEQTVVLERDGNLIEIPNDFVWIFAGGTPPNAFLEKIAVRFGSCDLTLEAGNEARSASQAARVASAPVSE